MTTTLEISEWSAGRCAVAGIIPEPETLLNRMKDICRPVNIEFWSGSRFTFSFPAPMRRQVVRLVEEME